MAHILEEYVLKEEGSFAACRLKRIDSIKGKLARKGHTYKLNSMYDIAGCPSRDEDAVAEYSRVERQKRSSEDAVFLKASSMEDIQKTYPNYYSDISLFLEKMIHIL